MRERFDAGDFEDECNWYGDAVRDRETGLLDWLDVQARIDREREMLLGREHELERQEDL